MLVFFPGFYLCINFIYLFNLFIYHVYFFIYIYTFSQYLHPADARGTASFQIMEFEFAIMCFFFVVFFLFFFFAIRRKAEGHIFQHSVLPYFRPSKIVGTLCA